jgi:hypothetical protein
MISGKKQKIFWSVAAGAMTLCLGGTVLAESGGFLATIVRAGDIPPDSITVSAVNIIDDANNGTTAVSTIEVNKGRIRMKAVVMPAEASQKVVWTVTNGTGTATCDRCGQLCALNNGIVTVTATSADDPSIMGQEDITISHQFEGIDLKTAGNYAILAKTGISAAGIVRIGGDIAVSPIGATALTGFSETADSTKTFSTSSYVTGKLYAADYTAPTPAALTTAVGDMAVAYTTGSGLVPPVSTNFNGGDLSGQTLAGGIYKWDNNVLINTDATLNGSATDYWVFQIAGGISQAAGTKIVLSGGARAENVFWLSATTITLGANSHFEGIALSQTDITLDTGCKVNGRLLAQTRVNLGVSSVVNYPGYVVS